MGDIKQTLSDYIKTEFQIPDDDTDFTYDVNLFDYGYVDSLGAATIIAFVESKYNIEITQKDLMLNSMNSIDEIADFTERKAGENK